MVPAWLALGRRRNRRAFSFIQKITVRHSPASSDTAPAARRVSRSACFTAKELEICLGNVRPKMTCLSSAAFSVRQRV